MSGELADPASARAHGLRRLGVTLLILTPLVVGLVAALVLGALQSHEQAARNTRLVLAQIHEDALLQQEIISHAQVMGYLTADLPLQFATLRHDTNTHVTQLERVAGPGVSVTSVTTAWYAYEAAAAQIARSLRVQQTMPPQGASAPKMATSMTPTTSTTAAASMTPTMSMTPAASVTPAPSMTPATPKTGQVATSPAPSGRPASDPPTFTRFLNAINASSSSADDRVQAASTAARSGSLLTVTMEALILALAFLWFGRVRNRAAEESRRVLADSEARFRSLVQNASDVVMVLNPERHIEYVTPSILGLLGLDAEELLGRPISQFVNRQDISVLMAFMDDAVDEDSRSSNSIEFRLRHHDENWVHVEALARHPRDDGSDLGLILTMRDTTERKAFEDQLAHQAFHDALTGLPNRALFQDRLSHALTRRSEDASTVAVLFLDLDDFKTVNDSLGHDAGDEVLTEVADRLRECLRSGDTPARLGGDEFAVLLEGINDIGEAVETGRRIILALARPLRLRGRELSTTACIGISLGLPQLSQAEDLLRDADTAMYVAKARGRGSVEVFEEVMHSVAEDRLALKTDLENALARDEFVVHYQPTVDLATDQITGFEALVRWRHPERGLVPPMAFIPLAEETGLIVALGRWVLREACRQARAWQAALPSLHMTSMSVNVSVKQLESEDFVDEVRAALAWSGLEPRALILEITEGVLLRETAEIAARLGELKQLGVRLAIDDFGTGYSSLGYLQTLPLDVLKIDKRFVDNVASGTGNAALASAIIAIGQALGMNTVAEGIEREEQANTLRRLNCQFGQGYMFARPLDVTGIEQLLGLAPPPDSDGGRGAVPGDAANPATATTGSGLATVGSTQIRQWARSNGFPVASRGPIPAAARAAYAEAHS